MGAEADGAGLAVEVEVDPDAAFVFVEAGDGAEVVGEGAFEDADAVAGGEDAAGLDLAVLAVKPFGVGEVVAVKLAGADFVGEVFEEVAAHAADVGVEIEVGVQEDVAGQEGFFAVAPLAGDFFRQDADGGHCRQFGRIAAHEFDDVEFLAGPAHQAVGVHGRWGSLRLSLVTGWEKLFWRFDGRWFDGDNFSQAVTVDLNNRVIV